MEPWAKVALSWANADKLVNGAEENGKLYLQPAGSATRAQVAAILMRYVQYVVNWRAPTETESRTSAFTEAAQKLENSDLQGAWDLYDGYVSDLIGGRGDCYFWPDGYATGYACDVVEYSYIYTWDTAFGNMLQIWHRTKGPIVSISFNDQCEMLIWGKYYAQTGGYERGKDSTFVFDF